MSNTIQPQPDTTTAARELARELRENNGSMRTVANTADTLDALADENERLCEAVAHYLDTGFVSARNELSAAIGREVEPPSEPGSWRNAAGVVTHDKRTTGRD